ncbi:hypothetical protein ACMGE5_09610 [Macrococcus equi]|uniref:hypothetical protein n=1 Tax=Macrococcus equi TaxID=3395462 RepID=UPI0039BEB289
MTLQSSKLAERCAHLPGVMDYIVDLYEPFQTIESTMTDEDLLIFTKIHVLNYLVQTSLKQCFYEGKTEILHKEVVPGGLFKKEKVTYTEKHIEGIVPAQFILERFTYEIYNPHVWLNTVTINQDVLNQNSHIKNRADQIDEILKRTLFTLNVKEKSFSYDIYKITFAILEDNLNFYDDWFKSNDIRKYFEDALYRAIQRNIKAPYSVTKWMKRLEKLV